MSEILGILLFLLAAFLFIGFISTLSEERWFADLLDWLFEKTIRRRKSSSGPQALLGEVATVKKPFSDRSDETRSFGTVAVRGELWRARLRTGAPNEPGPGDQVRIVAVEGLTVEVESI